MSSKRFFITEVFAEAAYGGNQLATVLDAEDITTERMQQIARAFNLSETTFLTGGSQEAGFDVRIFTPANELPFAGHPTLGSAFVLRHLNPADEQETLVLNLGVGQIPVTFGADGVLWMRQKPPLFGETVDPARVAASIGLTPTDIESRFPCQYVSTGIRFLLVPLTSLSALKAIVIRNDDFGMGLFAFCPEGYEAGQSMAARMFAARMGVVEDPATGSANGCLAGYLVEHQYFGSPEISLSVAQGYEVQRPSQLYLRASKAGTRFDVNVGGKVRLVGEGEWQV